MASQTHSTTVVRASSGRQTQSAADTDQLGGTTVFQTEQGVSSFADELSQLTASPAHQPSELQPSLRTRLARLMFNLFPLVVVAVFFWLQVQIDVQNTGLLRTLVIIMSVLVELGVIFIWSLFI